LMQKQRTIFSIHERAAEIVKRRYCAPVQHQSGIFTESGLLLHGVRHSPAAQIVRRRTRLLSWFAHAKRLQLKTKYGRHRHLMEVWLLRPGTKSRPDNGNSFPGKDIWIF